LICLYFIFSIVLFIFFSYRCSFVTLSSVDMHFHNFPEIFVLLCLFVFQFPLIVDFAMEIVVKFFFFNFGLLLFFGSISRY
jgi:hypothetical protein